MASQNGKCTNFGLCDRADSREVIAVTDGGEWTCPDCGKELSKTAASGGSSRGFAGKKPLLVGGLAVVLLGGVYAFLPADEVTTGGTAVVDDPYSNITPPNTEPLPGPGVQDPPILQPEPVRQDPPPGTSNPYVRPQPQVEPAYEPPSEPIPTPQRSQPPARRTASGPLDDTMVVATLLSPISTKTSQQGDTFQARITSPAGYDGAILSGTITKLQKKKKNSELAFQFEQLTHRGTTIPIQADLQDVANAQGVKNVDEEGHVISKASKKKMGLLSAIGAGTGAVIGGLTGGGKGAAVGAGVGAGAGLALSLTVVSRASDIHLVPGSTLTLVVNEAATRTARR